jgi:hypothetical protein
MIPPNLQVTVVCVLSVMWNTYFSIATAALSVTNASKPDAQDFDGPVLNGAYRDMCNQALVEENIDHDP